jgi:hypothetical protein
MSVSTFSPPSSNAAGFESEESSETGDSQRWLL